VIGVTERGICWLSFVPIGDEPSVEVDQMNQHWHNSIFHQNQVLTFSFIQKIFSSHLEKNQKIHLLVKGTNFQVKVWQALLKLPAGSGFCGGCKPYSLPYSVPSCYSKRWRTGRVSLECHKEKKHGRLGNGAKHGVTTNVGRRALSIATARLSSPILLPPQTERESIQAKMERGSTPNAEIS